MFRLFGRRCSIEPLMKTSSSLASRPFRRRSRDRKSTRLNSSHSQTSYAVFCLKKKTAAAERGADSRNQLSETKGLSNVVVCTQRECEHLVPLFLFGRQHRDRCVGIAAAQVLNN